jgi:hypothetical protein
VARPEVALARLREMRQRRRGLRAWTGLFLWLLLVAVTVWGTFLLDYSLALPLGIRAFHLVVAGVLLAVGFKILLLAARTPIPEDRLAAEIEAAAGDLEQGLITAIQLTRPDNPRRDLYSPALLSRTIRDAEERMARLVPGALLSRRKVKRAAALFALAAAPLIIGAALRPDLAETYVRRGILLEPVDWPREYFLRIVEPASHEQLLAVGDSLTVQAVREHGGGARARIEAVFTASDGDETTEELPLERRGDDSFRRVFRNVSRDFRFRVHCGDFTSSWFSIQVRNRPRVEEIALSFDFPDYTGLDESGAPRGIAGGHCKVPIGTVIAYRARTSIPVREAVRVETRRVGDGEASTEEPVGIAEGSLLEGSFTAEENAYYHFRLVSEDGFENPNPIRYRIAVIPDLAPSVQVIEPGRNRELSPQAALTVTTHIEDDYGIAGGEIRFYPEGESETATEPYRAVPLATLVPGARLGEPSVEIDLSGWQLEAGVRLEYRVEATDAIGQVGRSRTWLLTIVSVEDLERILQESIPLIRERLQETFEVERDARRGLEDLLEQSQLAGGTLPEEARPGVRHARVGQERVNTRLEEGVERFQELIDQVVQNRLTDFRELPWIEELSRRLDELARGNAGEALSSLDEMTRGPESRPIPSADLERAIEKVRGTERELQGILDELEEWGDLQTVIRRLEDLLRSQRDLEKQVEDRVRESLGGARPAEPAPAEPPDGDDR